MISLHFLIWVIFLVQAYHGKFQSSVEHTKIGQAWPFYTSICFMVLCIIPPNFRLITEIFQEWERKRCPSDLVHAYHGKFQSSVECTNIGWANPFSIASCFMVLCITPPNFRSIGEILKELEQQHRSSDLLKVYTKNFKVPWNVLQLAQHGHFL